MKKMLRMLLVGLVLTGALALGEASPASAAAIKCAISKPMYRSGAGCSRVTWNESTGVMCWSHQLIGLKGYKQIFTEMKHSGQSQWRRTVDSDTTLDNSYSSGCTPRRGKPGALPHPTAARAVMEHNNGTVHRHNFEIVLVG